MPVKLFKTDAKREEGWDYYFDDGMNIYRVPLADDDEDEEGDDEVEPELVAKVDLPPPGEDQIYFIDEDCDVASRSVEEYAQEQDKAFEEVVQQIVKERATGEAATFAPGESDYWICKGNRRRNDLREMLAPERVHTWSTARLPAALVDGDRVIMWESAPHLKAVGIADVGGWDDDKDLFGNAHFWLAYRSPYIEGGPGIEELRKDPLFDNASFLKAAVAGTLFPLTTEQGAELARRLAVLHPAILEAWPDLKGGQVVISPASADEPEAADASSCDDDDPSSHDEEEHAAGQEAETEGDDDDEDQVEIVAETRIAREDGWTYQPTREGGVRRFKANDKGKPIKGSEEILVENAFVMEPGWLYGVTYGGDVCRVPLRKRRKTPYKPGKASPRKDGKMRALSIRQPWAELIMRGVKTLEYRSRPTNIRERVHIYAGLGDVPEDHIREVAEHEGWTIDFDVDNLPRGVLVGTVEITECIELPDGKFTYKVERPERAARKQKPKNHPQPGFFYPF